MKKNVVIASVIGVILVLGSLYGLRYQENKKIGKACATMSIKLLVESSKSLSIAECRRMIRAAGGVEEFREILD